MAPKKRPARADSRLRTSIHKGAEAEMFNLLGRNRNRDCEHPTTSTTANYGLIRTVCRDCGMVHIEDMGSISAPAIEVATVEELEVTVDADDQSLASTG